MKKKSIKKLREYFRDTFIADTYIRPIFPPGRPPEEKKK